MTEPPDSRGDEDPPSRDHPASGMESLETLLGHSVDPEIELDPGDSLDDETIVEQPAAPGPFSAAGRSADAAATGRHEVRGEIARGGMGAIFKVRDADLRRTLAMKVILGGTSGSAATGTPVSPELLQRYLSGHVVRAHKSGVVVEMKKWVARNKAVAATAAAACVVVAALTTVFLFSLAAERDRALTAESDARENAADASRERDRAVTAEAGAQEQAAEAERQRVLADTRASEAVSERERAAESPAEHPQVAYARYTAKEFVESATAFERALEDEGIRADLNRGNLYNAACAAALATSADADETARFRARALEWLGADLEGRRSLLATVVDQLADGEGDAAQLDAQKAFLLKHFEWARTGDPDFAGLRGSTEFAQLVEGLPTAE